MRDFNLYIDNNYEPKYKKTLTCTLRLDKKSMIEALQVEAIIINGRLYKVPEKQLLQFLVDKRYGSVKIEFDELI